MSRISGLALFMIRRALATPQLLLIRFIGTLVAVILVAGVSLYSTAMGDAMLQQRLQIDPTNTNLAVSVNGHSVSGSSYAQLDTYLKHRASADLALPLQGLRIHHNTAILPLFRLGHYGHALSSAPIASLALDYYEGVQQQVVTIAGTLDVPSVMPDGDVPIEISQYTAQSLNLHVGDRLAFSWDHQTAITPQMVVAGIFVAQDFRSTFWDIHAGEKTYRALVAPNLDVFQDFAMQANMFSPSYFWLQHTNVAALHLSSATSTLDRLNRFRSTLATIASGATLITSLDEVINGFLSQYELLPSILLILVLPIIALILYEVSVTTALALDRQAAEIVLIRSRGATPTQVFAVYSAEGLVLGCLALLIGPLLGLPLARLIGAASGFLSFQGGLPFSLHLVPETYLYCTLTAILCLLAGLVPAVALSRRSMLSFKSEQARPSGKPLWQRLYLDVILLGIALYGLDLLVRQGPITSGTSTAVVAQDPLIAVAPLLFAVAITLLLSRILPWLAALGLRVFGVLSSPATHVALQSVARAPRQPMRLVQLCTLTLTLGIFAATVAGVEQSNVADQYLYQAGATLRLGETFNRQSVPPSMKKEPDAMPLSAHLALPGVHAATPALRFESFGNVVNMLDSGTVVNVLGVDPATAPTAMWYRADFAAGQSLTSLLHSIASSTPDALVSDSFLTTTGLHIGDTFEVALSTNVLVSFRIAGHTRFFPTLDPGTYPFVVANLAYLSAASKSHGPNEVWLKTDPSQSAIDRIELAASQWPRQVLSYSGLPPADATQNNPLTTGIYGVVSVGFLIAAALALLGFVTYAYLTLQQRIAEVAILRAMGLSHGQVRLLLLFEQLFLLGAAILGGITAGLLTTQLFLPYLPIAANVVPPFIVVMPWPVVVEFVVAVLLVFLIVLSIHVSLLLRVQLGRVLRLGEG